MIVELLTEHHLGFLSLKGCCTGSSESTLVKIPHCWKSHVAAQMICILFQFDRTALDIAVINGRPDIVQTIQLAHVSILTI